MRRVGGKRGQREPTPGRQTSMCKGRGRDGACERQAQGEAYDLEKSRSGFDPSLKGCVVLVFSLFKLWFSL